METPTFEAAQDRLSPTFIRDMQIRSDGLERVAGAARGTVFQLVGSDPRPFQRIAQEIAGTYLLAFEAVDADRDGRLHRIAISLARGGAQVRAREVFRLAPVAPSPRAREETLVQLLRNAQPITELPLRVATYTYVEPRGDFRVVVSMEAPIAAGNAAEVLLGYVLVDSRGVVAASGAHRAEAARHAFSTVVPAGAYTLRVAGIDLLGRHGLVERPFAAVVQTAAGVRWSDLIVAPMPASAEAQLQPAVDRMTDRRVTAYLELYAAEAGRLRDAHVTFEVASDREAAAQVTVDAQVLRRDARWAIARAELPLVALAAGGYVARAKIVMGSETVGQAIRPFTLVTP
jgi:hypothetical protein